MTLETHVATISTTQKTVDTSHLILVLLLEILLHGPHDGHARTEEDVALEIHDP